ncbi:hypothetical protein KG090_04355 [Carnobacteriaceae bacterium zg-ZUI240]|nr:hypothetical protein [Carnobacteriaceae bacterium zg-ZUI240]
MFKKITIGTLDNPGWWVDVYFEKNVSSKKIQLFKRHHTDFDWVFAYIEDNKFIASGDSQKLSKIIRYIIEYAEIKLVDKYKFLNLLKWLSDWYTNECDEYWEHLYGIKGEMNEKCDVFIQIDLDETIWEDEYFKPILKCEKIDTKFIIKCKFSELVDNLIIFKNWIKSL